MNRQAHRANGGRRWIEKRLQQVFDRWGYHRIITSTIERLDTLMAGGAIARSTVIQFQDREDELLGLRPELTASIARAAVTRMAGVASPQRLYYNANVFRRPTEASHGTQQEFFQAGVELLGTGGLMADAEILLLLSNCLESLGITNWQVVLGEAGLTRSLLSSFPAAVQDKVRDAIADLDLIRLEKLPLSEELRDRARFLFDLRGKPADVLQKVATLNLDIAQQEALNNLKSLVALLDESYRTQKSDRTVSFPLTLDLSLIQSLDYYTGIVFKVVGDRDTQAQIVGQGGRYDQLLGLYHPQGQSAPGIGFAFNIEDLYQILLYTDKLPYTTPESDYLVVPANRQAYAAAIAYAQKLRDSADLVRVELELGERTNPEDIRAYARHCEIPKIVWVQPGGEAQIEEIDFFS